MHTMGPVDVSLALAVFHERHPGVELTVREQSSEELAEMLREDELDLAFLSVTEWIEQRGLGLHQLVSEELVAILPPSHPLAERPGVHLGELAGEQFISYRAGSRLRELLNQAASEAGFDPHVMLESNESRRIRRLVGRGMGVAILPRSDTDGEAEVAVVDLIEPALTRDITLAWRQGRRHPPAVTEFIELSRTLFARPASATGSAPEPAGEPPRKRAPHRSETTRSHKAQAR
jgi:DNA-binding transcriptional LysR family regulator